MRAKQTTIVLGLAVAGIFLAGCDPLMAETYRGESRLSFRIEVFNSSGESATGLVPAFAHVDDSGVLFRSVPFENIDFGSSFRLYVYDPPRADQLVPLDRFLAPDVFVSREYIGAVVESKLNEVIPLESRREPVHRYCWSGGPVARCEIEAL